MAFYVRAGKWGKPGGRARISLFHPAAGSR
jgi:hypothetical protein